MTTSEQDAPDRDRNHDGDDRDAEIARLRERVAFYESFDRVIAENVARSGELLRQAMETQSTATSELTIAQEEADRRRTEELASQRSLLSALLDDVIQLQGQAERLARRVADALDEVESELPTGDFPTKQTASSELPPDAPPVELKANATPAVEQAGEPRLLTVLAHSLPDAAAARSLREHLAGLAQVSAVEPREFAAGVLRLDVTTREPVAVADLDGWTIAGPFESVTERDDLIEIRLSAGSQRTTDAKDNER